MNVTIRMLDDIAQTLYVMAAQHPEDSEEAEALMDAADALSNALDVLEDSRAYA